MNFSYVIKGFIDPRRGDTMRINFEADIKLHIKRGACEDSANYFIIRKTMEDKHPDIKRYFGRCNKIGITTPYSSIYSSYAVNDESLYQARQFFILKKTYNVWDEKLGNPEAMKRILTHFQPNSIYIMGVALNICVLAAAKGLAKLLRELGMGPNLWLIKDATIGLSADADLEATKQIMDCGFARISAGDL